MIYLASPYSGTHEQKEFRYREVMRCIALLIDYPDFVYSPILYCHEMAKLHSMPTDAAFWKLYNERVISQSQGVWILCIDGWKESVGVAMEIMYSKEHSIRLTYVIPDGDGFRISQELPS